MKTINLQQNPTNNNILQNSLDTNKNILMPTEKINEILNENIGLNNFHYMDVKNKKYVAPSKSNFVPFEQKTSFLLADEQPPLIVNDAEIIKQQHTFEKENINEKFKILKGNYDNIT
jgi:hypothetical protein